MPTWGEIAAIINAIGLVGGVYVAWLKLGALSTDVARLEKNTNSISERNQAIAMKLGITEGIAQERASVQANTNVTAALAPNTVVVPVPVADQRTAAAAEQTAVASERSAAATERVADAAENSLSKKP